MGGATLKGDHIVVGSGMAGFCAAMALKRAGREVAIVTKGVGASVISSGAWDFGPIRSGYTLPFSEVRKTLAWRVIYQHLLVDKFAVPDAGQAAETLELVQKAFGADLPLAFRYDRPFCLPTTSGNWKWTFGAQEIQTRGDLQKWANKKIGLVTSVNWRLQGPMLARQLTEIAQDIGIAVDVVPLELNFGKVIDWAMPNFAARLAADEKLQAQFRDELRRAIDANRCDLVLTPPLFLDPRLADRLASEIGLPVAECLATSEPIPGQRLHRAMEAALVRAEIPKHLVPQIDVRRSVGEILTLEIGEGRTLKGEQFYLATGKFIGGGVKLGFRDVSETLFGLPLFWHRTSEPVAFRSQLPIHPDTREAQPWARLGVWLNEKWQPQDQNRKSVYDNVVACGSLVGGVDYARENLGLGYMAYSGRRCADVAP